MTRQDIYLPFIPMDTAYGVDEIFLPESDDGTSNAISIVIPFPFGQSNQNQFYVSIETKKVIVHNAAKLPTGGNEWTSLIW